MGHPWLLTTGFQAKKTKQILYRKEKQKKQKPKFIIKQKKKVYFRLVLRVWYVPTRTDRGRTIG